MKTFFLFLIALAFLNSASAQTTLTGKITDENTGEELIGANIVVEQNGVFRSGTATDFDGNYNLYLDPGTYDVKVSNIAYQEYHIIGVIVQAGKSTKLDVQMMAVTNLICICCGCWTWTIPLIDPDNTSSGSTIISDDINLLPTKNVDEMLINTAGLSLGRF